MNYFKKIRFFSLLASIFFLPIDINLNNIFLLIFISVSVFTAFKSPRVAFKALTQKKGLLILVSLPFWLNIFGLIYTDELNKGIDYTVRALPFLLIPLVAITSPKVFAKNYRAMGYALLFGCLFVAVWSWYFSIQSLLENNRPFKELFGPLHSNHNLLKHLDMHATYLSVFIYTSLAFIATEYRQYIKYKKIVLAVVFIVLLAFLFHLLSRIAIFYFILSSIIYLIYNKYWKLLSGLAIVIIVVFGYAYSTPHNYLRDRLINNLNLFEKKTQFSKKDDRFDRLSASFEIFKQRPIFGYGTAGESKHRREIFKKNRDTIAYNENYNAHNQFVEYLSTFGILGGLVFVIFFGTLIYLVFTKRQYFYAFMLVGVFFACITESVFERSWGVVYTALLAALILSSNQISRPLKNE